MRKSFGSRGRVPRKVGQDDDDESGAASSGGDHAHAPEPVVKRPASKTKKRSSLRLSFGPAESGADSEGDGGAVFTPKKSNLSRIATQRNAERKGFRASLSADQIPSRRDATDDERPSYSKDYLDELRNSTPSTPKEEYQKGNGKDVDTMIKDLDIASKFGPLATLSASTTPSAIPTDAEIREKKERRARLAQQQQQRNPDFMSLDASDDDGAAAASDGYDSDDLDRPRDSALRSSGIKEKYAETRLVPDDEDIAEGFDEFVSDGRIALGRAAEREAARRRRAEMASMIADAEGGDGTPAGTAANNDDDDDSEAERNAAYEAAQTRAGTYAARDRATNVEEDPARPRTPPRIAPLPELGGVVARLRGAVRAAEEARAAKARRVEELVRERKDIVAQEEWIQKELREAGERYERLRAEAGGAGGAATPVDANGVGGRGGTTPRGLDSLGASPAVSVGVGGSEGEGEGEGESKSEAEMEGDDYGDEDEDMADARPGLGARAGLGA
ncbi:uncharacterized protein K452DRAFT_315089 [Aplosporella prunicola CBS 121167]|uniref:Nineteen complex-related protein 2-domain-containing protein n=1 Tax=Aplosporella prunicola CBS 121167 TaxID=1176127 RepID=A0A6A6BS26_9PEZI|nr:uncharacterized protein K452DRAFT_315089 [Aplosporella prunicola CBS 121167]KAF2146886.1 hypothetical protein K452DRAFT_315089 [Aplosporella prunicola CBS 121167]